MSSLSCLLKVLFSCFQFVLSEIKLLVIAGSLCEWYVSLRRLFNLLRHVFWCLEPYFSEGKKTKVLDLM